MLFGPPEYFSSTDTTEELGIWVGLGFHWSQNGPPWNTRRDQPHEDPVWPVIAPPPERRGLGVSGGPVDCQRPLFDPSKIGVLGVLGAPTKAPLRSVPIFFQCLSPQCHAIHLLLKNENERHRQIWYCHYYPYLGLNTELMQRDKQNMPKKRGRDCGWVE